EHLRDNLAFGKGIHFCLGANLSRLEGKVAAEELDATLVDPGFDEPHRDLANDRLHLGDHLGMERAGHQTPVAGVLGLIGGEHRGHSRIALRHHLGETLALRSAERHARATEHRRVRLRIAQHLHDQIVLGHHVHTNAAHRMNGSLLAHLGVVRKGALLRGGIEWVEVRDVDAHVILRVLSPAVLISRVLMFRVTCRRVARRPGQRHR
ncbi:MAG: hypothetical protein EB037_10075, partial [Actinobacteria bacterium]|nr:hypothetical protein [Actinomycetota bacterium]